jgi:hypothetical protein
MVFISPLNFITFENDALGRSINASLCGIIIRLFTQLISLKFMNLLCNDVHFIMTSGAEWNLLVSSWDDNSVVIQ